MVTRSPMKKKRTRQCIFVEDEAIEGDSNDVEEEIDALEGDSNEHQIHVDVGDATTTPSSQPSTDLTEKEEKRRKHGLGEKVPLGLMSEVLSKFHVKRTTEPPLVPLCCLLPNESVRIASEDASWLVSLFDDNAYMENIGSFLVSVRDTHGTLLPVTTEVQASWDPIWQQKSQAFDQECNEEWSDLRGHRFLVWDGNHRLKTWTKRVKESEYLS